MPYLKNYTLSSGESPSATIVAPTGIATNDVLIYILRSNNTLPHSIESGWSAVATGLTINNFNNQYYGISINSKIATGSESNITIPIDSGKYVGAYLVFSGSGIDNKKSYNNGVGCISCVLYGRRVSSTGQLDIDVLGTLSPVGHTGIKVENLPYNGTYHEGVGLYLNIQPNINSSIGWSAPFSFIRASGNILNSGNTLQPPSLYYCGISLGLK